LKVSIAKLEEDKNTTKATKKYHKDKYNDYQKSFRQTMQKVIAARERAELYVSER